MKFLLAHHHPAPFVQQAGRALHEAGLLGRFAATLLENRQSPWQRTAAAAARIAGRDLWRQLARRGITEFPAELAVSHPRGEIARLLSARLSSDGIRGDRAFHRMRDDFDRWTARRCLDGIEAVYCYEYNSRELLREAERRGLRRVYDVPSPQHDYVHRLLDAELAQFPELETPYARHCRERHDERTAYRRAEFDAAELVVAASEFTRRSFAEAGWPTEKIRVVPYGAPPPVAGAAEGGGSAPGEPLRVLWAGTFGLRKGAHHLLDAWVRLSPGASARLDIYGAAALPERLLRALPPGVRLSPTVPRAELSAIYAGADVLVFPTLCDGFGMVATEALAHGLPVITTRNAGAADLIEEGRNGLLVEPGSVDALAERLAWCLEHRAELRAMRAAALESAAAWQWSDYRALLRRTIGEALGIEVRAGEVGP